MSGISGVPRIDFDTGHIEPADKIVIPETGLSLSDNTTANVSTSKHGLCPKAPNDASKYLDGTGAWTTPDGGGSGSTPSGTGWRHVADGVEDGVASTPTKSDVGLGNVTNDAQVKRTEMGAASGVATLDSGTKVPTAQVPAVTEAMQTLADNTTGDVSTSKHGYAPKAPNDASKYLDGTGAWSAPAGGGGGGYTTGYSVDFSALDPQNLLTGGNGNKTIDGKTWILANSANLQTAYINDGTHAGLYLRCNANNSANDATNLTGGAVHISLGTLVAALGSPTSEIWLWFMYSQPHVPNANYEAASFGCLLDYASYAYNGLSRISVQTQFTNVLYYGWTQSANNGNLSYGGAASLTERDVFVLRVNGAFIETYYGASGTGAFPSRSSLVASGATLRMPRAGAAYAVQLAGIRLWVSVASGNASGAADLLAKKLLVEYR